MKLFLAILFSVFLVYLGYSSGTNNQNNTHYTTNIGYTHHSRIHAIVNSHRPIAVYADVGIDQRHVELMEEALNRFKILPGIQVMIVTDPRQADVVAINWINLWNNTFVGFQPENTDVILLDINRLYIDSGFQIAFMHEFGHWLGMQHICRFPDERTVCSPVGYGRAVLNPAIGYQDGDSYDYSEFFTELDLLEFQRVMAISM